MFLGKSHGNDDMANLPLVIKEKDVKYQVMIFFSFYFDSIRIHNNSFYFLLYVVFSNCDVPQIASRLSLYPSKPMERSQDRYATILS